MSTKPRTRSSTGDTEVEPIRLCRRDRRKFYAMLDADLPPRIGRIEMALAVLVPSNLALLWKVFGSPGPQQVAAGFVHLLFP